MMDRRTLLGVVAGMTATMGLSACGGRDEGAQEGADAVPASWLRCRIGSPAGIDPLHVVDRAGLQVLSALFTPLLRLDANGAPIAGAAVSVEASEDLRTFTFKLVPGSTFHNAEAVTASSFKLAWERLVRALPVEGDRDAATPEEREHCRWGSLLSLVEGYDALHAGRASELVGLRCPDDLTYVVSLTDACPYFPVIAAHPALGPIPLVAMEDAEGFAQHPVGNGPFKLKRDWKAGAKIWLAAFADAVAGSPVVPGVLLEPIADTVAAYKQFRADSIDICDVPVDQLSDAEDMTRPSADGSIITHDERLAHGVEAGLTYLACNCTSGAFGQPDIRRAAALSIDREALCRKVLKYSEEAANGPISPRVGDTAPWEACAYDPERAAQLVESAVLASQAVDPALAMGSTEEGADAAPVPDAAPTVEPDPLSLSVDLIYLKGGAHARVAAQLVRDLEAAGLSVRSEALGAEDFLERYRTAEFDCALRTLDPAAPEIELIADALFAREGAVGGIPAAYDAAVSATLAEARVQTDPGVRAELVAQALAMAGESLPIIPLSHPAYTKMASDRVTASSVNAMGLVNLSASDLL